MKSLYWNQNGKKDFCWKCERDLIKLFELKIEKCGATGRANGRPTGLRRAKKGPTGGGVGAKSADLGPAVLKIMTRAGPSEPRGPGRRVLGRAGGVFGATPGPNGQPPRCRARLAGVPIRILFFFFWPKTGCWGSGGASCGPTARKLGPAQNDFDGIIGSRAFSLSLFLVFFLYVLWGPHLWNRRLHFRGQIFQLSKFIKTKLGKF